MVGRNGNKEKIEPIEKEKIDELSKKHIVTIENNVMYDAAYVYSMVQADFFGKSIPYEQYAIMYVKDVLGDEDKPNGYVFNRWYAYMCFMGIPIDWQEYV